MVWARFHDLVAPRKKALAIAARAQEEERMAMLEEEAKQAREEKQGGVTEEQMAKIQVGSANSWSS